MRPEAADGKAGMARPEAADGEAGMARLEASGGENGGSVQAQRWRRPAAGEGLDEAGPG